MWGDGYATNANNNILVMIQIESPAGVGVIDNILNEVEGIDIVMVASNDFGLFAGDRDGSPSYNAREKSSANRSLLTARFSPAPRAGATAPATCCSRAPRPPRPRDTKRTSLSLLSRLCFVFGNSQIACIDLYQAHIGDPVTPLEETLAPSLA